eukprot:CAMPEP_0116149198 /NCGR_PEP_ID=MMETSP0329-20121206/18795_1 /TAXON_ID=697910 /ORGANISM="Pseudo-nitzschia arenysensis, Strain B593" /LENGTH=333 /DNA_ID=CAMNT_0003645447 /DNA_START=223 /DNA_END=1224 /DNA_ORIENTATION=-
MLANGTKRSESETGSDSLGLMENMLQKEQTIYAQHDYFARPLPVSPGSDMPVDAVCRSVMAKWCSSLCHFCRYDRRMVESVMSCVDRYVATKRGSRILLSRDDYQLAVMASLYLVAKIQQTQALEPESVAKLSRGKYNKADIETMELDILCSLEWYVNPPTAMSFAQEFMEQFEFVPENYEDNSDDSSATTASTASTTEDRIMDLVRFQIEEATGDYELSCLTRPSHVAFGAFSNALQSLNIDGENLSAMQTLKNKLQMIDEEFISSSLLRLISSGESNELSSLLLHGCSGHTKRIRNKRNHKEEQCKMGSSRRPSSASITASPRAVVEGITC